jgi:hypothetical protein
VPPYHQFRVDNNDFKKYNVVLKGPLMRLSGTDIIDMLYNLVLDENGDQFFGYGKMYN